MECIYNFSGDVHPISRAWIGNWTPQCFGRTSLVTPQEWIFLQSNFRNFFLSIWIFSYSSMLIWEKHLRSNSLFYLYSPIFHMGLLKPCHYQVNSQVFHSNRCTSSTYYYSGIMAILFCGITMSQYTQQNISPVTQITFRQTFRTISFVAGIQIYVDVT